MGAKKIKDNNNLKPSSLNIHIIDDDQDDIYLITQTLNELNSETVFNISHSGRIAEGIEALKRKSAHIILLDLSLPDASGFEGLKLLQQEFPSSNIIILTGLKDQEMALKALQEGASDYLTKNELNPTLLSRTLLFSHERQKLEEQLRQSRKLEAIGQLAGGLAHDFNNQLGILMLLLEQSINQLHNSKDIGSNLENMVSIVDKCTSMTKQVLGFSRKQTLYPQVQNANSLLEKLIPIAKRLLGSNVQLHAELDPNVANIFVDQNQLEQVLWNLIVNAKHALEDNKEITLRTKCVRANEIQGFVEPPTHDNPLIMIEIEDSGSGINPEVMDKIFEPFFTTKPSGEGTGLGLSSALGFVKQSGGYIAVSSVPGQGTSFKLLFPVYEGEEITVVEEVSGETIEAGSSQGLRVLICDDEPLLLELIADIFEDCGFETLTANDGLEGKKIFQKNANNIDLVVTDMTMPKMNGIDLLQTVQECRPELQAVLMTGFLKSDSLEDLNSELITVINKPFSVTQFKERLAKVITKIKSSKEEAKQL